MQRAVSPTLGVLLLTALTLVLAAVAGAAFVGTTPQVSAHDPVVLSASVDAATGRVVLVHEAGPTLDVREIEVRVTAGGVGLEHQPPVPFYSAPGFASFPSGPFNPVADPRWEVGETASLRVTGENAARLVRGAPVRIEVYRGDRRIASAGTTVG